MFSYTGATFIMLLSILSYGIIDNRTEHRKWKPVKLSKNVRQYCIFYLCNRTENLQIVHSFLHYLCADVYHIPALSPFTHSSLPRLTINMKTGLQKRLAQNKYKIDIASRCFCH